MMNFSAVIKKIESDANLQAKALYTEQLQKMMEEDSSITGFKFISSEDDLAKLSSSMFVNKLGLESDRWWKYKSDDNWHHDIEYGIAINFMAEVEIESLAEVYAKIESSKIRSGKTPSEQPLITFRLGDKPNYNLTALIIFSSTGDSADVILRAGIHPIEELGVTSELTSIVDKIKTRITAQDNSGEYIRASIHTALYVDWVLNQKNHPLRTKYIGEKFGI